MTGFGLQITNQLFLQAQPPACWPVWQILDLATPYNSVRQFLEINVSISLCTLLVLFL